jgi:hypothetical protein
MWKNKPPPPPELLQELFHEDAFMHTKLRPIQGLF